MAGTKQEHRELQNISQANANQASILSGDLMSKVPSAMKYSKMAKYSCEKFFFFLQKMRRKTLKANLFWKRKGVGYNRRIMNFWLQSIFWCVNDKTRGLFIEEKLNKSPRKVHPNWHFGKGATVHWRTGCENILFVGTWSLLCPLVILS